MSRARALLVLGVFAASLLGVLLTPWCTSDVASAEDFVAAARATTTGLAPGTFVLVHPPWRDDAVAALRAASVLPPGVVATTVLSPRHGEPLPPLLVLRDAGAPPLPRALRRQLGAEQALGPVRAAQVLPVAEGAATRELSDGLSMAEVELRRADGVTRCAWSPFARRHQCEGMPEWVHVGEEELPVAGHTERCTWAHPVTGATLVVRFPRARLLGELTLELALTDGAADNPTLAPVHGELLVDGVRLLELEKAPGQRGFVKQRASTGGGARDAAVELRLTTPNDGQRHTCFRLTTSSAP